MEDKISGVAEQKQFFILLASKNYLNKVNLIVKPFFF
jgi:hypothetical protein